MDYKEHELFRDESMHKKWTEEDLTLINDDTKWTVYDKKTRRILKSGCHDKEHLTDADYEQVTDVAYKHVAPNSNIWWIKVVGQINDAEISNVDDLLDASIKERQPEWHHLYVGGSILEQVTEGVEVCHFQYSSPIFLVAPRDTCYVKIRRHLDAQGHIQHDVKPTRGTGGGEGGFLLTYRSVDNHPHDHPDKKYVRIALKSSHRIQQKPDGTKGFIYTCLQHADAKMWARLSNGPQASIMLDEINGIRKAVLNPIRRPSTTSAASTGSATFAAQTVKIVSHSDPTSSETENKSS